MLCQAIKVRHATGDLVISDKITYISYNPGFKNVIRLPPFKHFVIGNVKNSALYNRDIQFLFHHIQLELRLTGPSFFSLEIKSQLSIPPTQICRRNQETCHDEENVS